MYLRIGQRIINTDNIVDARIFEAGETYDLLRPAAEVRTILISTTGFDRLGDGRMSPHEIKLEGQDADLFLAALPIHRPVMEGE